MEQTMIYIAVFAIGCAVGLAFGVITSSYIKNLQELERRARIQQYSNQSKHLEPLKVSDR